MALKESERYIAFISSDPSGAASYLFGITQPKDDIVPAKGDLLTILWPDDESETIEVIARVHVSNWEYDDRQWWIVVRQRVPEKWERPAYAVIREVTRLRSLNSGIAPRDPDTEPSAV